MYASNDYFGHYPRRRTWKAWSYLLHESLHSSLGNFDISKHLLLGVHQPYAYHELHAILSYAPMDKDLRIDKLSNPKHALELVILPFIVRYASSAPIYHSQSLW